LIDPIGSEQSLSSSLRKHGPITINVGWERDRGFDLP
jgi:hypothetical protein